MNDCLLLPMFPWTPIVQTSAANWLTRFRWKDILLTRRRESMMKKFRAVLEKCNIQDSLLMHVLVYILLWTTVCCYRCFHERQSYKRARPIGWLGSNERKYCQLQAANILWKNFEPFLRNISNRMSYKLMTRFRPIKCFLLSLLLWTPGRQTSAADWLTRFMWKQILSTLPRESIMKKFRAVLEKYNI